MIILSRKITLDKHKGTGWIHQPHLLDKLESKFGEMAKKLQFYRALGTPVQHILRNVDAEVDLDKHSI